MPFTCPDVSALELTLRPLLPMLADPEVTELCVNRPGQVFLETRSGWRCESIAAVDYGFCMRLAKLIANSTHQRIDESSPLLSAGLPGGERVQIVIPPATTDGTVAITIRRPTDRVWSVAELAQLGTLTEVRRVGRRLEEADNELLELLQGNRLQEFLRLAVRSRKNILVSGPAGSGKTTWTKALVREIPAEERLVTIEDTPELVLDGHPNHVRLFYSKDDQGLARVTPKQLLESCLRMKPDRVLLAELRADEAFDYLRNVNSGHPGSITSVHATSAELAFEQLVLLVQQSAGGKGMLRQDIKSLLYAVVDIVIQCSISQYRRFISEIWFEPMSKRDRLVALA